MLQLEMPVTLTIAPQWFAIAEKFAAEQDNPRQQTKIFQQTLAVLALERYLTLGDVETALLESYSWHPYSRVLTGWADLCLPEFGRLYCCVLGDDGEQGTIQLPSSLPLNTLGIVISSLVDDASMITLEGFLPQRHLASQQISLAISEAQAITTLFDELYFLAEERYLVRGEIQKWVTFDPDLQQFLSPFLMADNLLEIVNRLNQSLQAETLHPHDLFALRLHQKSPAAYTVSESMGDVYSVQPAAILTTEKINQAIATLTEQLFRQIKTLYQEFSTHSL